MSPSRAFPLFLRLDGRPVLVVGGGEVAGEKALALHAAGARVRVVAPLVSAPLAALAASVDVRPFEAADVDGVWFVIAAATPEVNRSVKAAGDARSVFVVAIDDLDSCSAFGAAQLHRGPLTIAISSDGRAPALVSLLRKSLEWLLVDDVLEWAALAERAREAWKAAAVPMRRRTPLLLSALNELYAASASPGNAGDAS